MCFSVAGRELLVKEKGTCDLIPKQSASNERSAKAHLHPGSKAQYAAMMHMGSRSTAQDHEQPWLCWGRGQSDGSVLPAQPPANHTAILLPYHMKGQRAAGELPLPSWHSQHSSIPFPALMPRGIWYSKAVLIKQQIF